MTKRTTAEHRAEVEAWRATAPEHDHDLFFEQPRIPGKPRKSKKPRHKGLANLGALWAMRNRPVGVLEDGAAQPLPVVSSNWRLTPANDNKRPDPDDGFGGTDRAVEYTPSLQAIKKSLAEIVVRYRPEPMMLPDEWNEDQRADREVHAIPVEGDFEYGIHLDENDNPHEVIVRIGKLRFSDGSQVEQGHKLIAGKVVRSRIKMPVGAMLGTREKSVRDKGSAPDPLEEALTFDYFAGENDPPGLFKNVQSARPVKKVEHRRPKEPETTKAQDRETLANAYANTPVLPPIKKCPDGFPAGPRNLAQLFPGLVKVATGDSGFHAWQDVVSERAEVEEWNATLQGMKDDDLKILTEATSAKSLGQLGEARGYSGKYAIEAGRRLLVAANDNFERAMEIAKEARRT
ncbi:hypothetical protein LAC81_01910 [Ensifer adhaerens]|nr:hypothetical protein [Ensifer adhaerens]UAX94576.1 hypothetical protein LAC78_01910 [Ensifer adhaerens]UAY02211.1 hypothetical protein LAC80_01910 [Ensifer adhaerens]UAY09595.1 hypothetical protein LAC81_01910 [Ensifer adhaerens]